MAESQIQGRKAKPQVHSQSPIEEPGQRIHGYVLSEEAEFRLRTIADAMRGIARLDEGEQGGDLPEMSSSDLAAIFRVIGEAAENIRGSATFAIGSGRLTPRTVN